MEMKKVLGLLLSIVLLFTVVPFAQAAQTSKYLPYEVVGDLYDGLAWFGQYDNNDNEVYGFIDTTGKVVIPAKYDTVGDFKDGIATVMINEKWGLIDKTGKEIIKPQFEGISGVFGDGLMWFLSNDKYGFIDITGKTVIPAQFDDTYNFGNGLAPVAVKGKYYFIDTTGKKAFEAEYDGAYNFSEGLAPVMKGRLMGYIDTTGKEVVAPMYDQAFVLTEGMAPVYRNDVWGFIDTTGKEVIKPQYEDVYSFSDGAAAVQVDGKYGFIDKKGKQLIKPVYSSIYTRFSEGLALVEKLSKEGYPLSGYVDLTGKEMTKFKSGFSGGSFDNGYAIVSDGELRTFYILKSPLLAPVSAKLTASKVLVNGKLVSFEAYNIGGSNYFKLRDLALAVNGTEKNFEVSFDSAKNAINLLSVTAYTSVSGELAPATGAAIKSAKPTSSKVYVDGQEAHLQAYNIGGNNYFKLRDLAKVFNIGVTWDAASSTIGIDPKLAYTE